MASLQKVIDLSKNTTALDTKFKGNTTKITDFTDKAAKAQTKLDALNSNSTLTSTCSSLSQGTRQPPAPPCTDLLLTCSVQPPPTRAAPPTAPPPPTALSRPATTLRAPATLSSPLSSPLRSPCSPCKRSTAITQAARLARGLLVPQRGGGYAGQSTGHGPIWSTPAFPLPVDRGGSLCVSRRGGTRLCTEGRGSVKGSDVWRCSDNFRTPKLSAIYRYVASRHDIR
jgi:hypothetical protein